MASVYLRKAGRFGSQGVQRNRTAVA
ncbi:MAG: hypothetical protein ACI8WY_001868, partial [Planctomycetota bacterium]